MELSRQEYPSMLRSLDPPQAVNILNERVRRVGKLNSEIADWLQERRRIEEAYVVGLKKLARKQPPDDNSELGIFLGPWQRIVSSTESIASSHQLLAQKIEVDVERPLRDFASKNREMLAMSTIQGNLGAMAKEVEIALDKAEKLKKKGGKSSTGKVAAASSEVERATSQWDSQAPFVFENLQAVDETRLNHLRDVLTQFQTHEVDQVERNRVTAEQCLNALLNVETADEIQTYVARMTTERSRTEEPRTRSMATASLAPPTATSTNDDRASQISRSSAGGPTSGAIQEIRQEKPSGLKRLGTVIGRRRHHAPPPPPPQDRATSPAKRSVHRFGSFGRSRDDQQAPSPGASAPSLAASPPRRDRIETQPLDAISPLQESGGTESTRLNGEPALQAPLEPTIERRETGDARNGDLAPIDENFGARPVPVQKDSEGFAIPPSSNDAISQAEREAAGENLQPQYKLDIRKDPIQEEGQDAETALANVASTLRSQQAVPRRQGGTARGRRDVRNTIFVPSPQSPEPGTGEMPSGHSPFKTSRSGTLSLEDNAASDTQSVRSARSLSSLTTATVRHPDLHQPGLNSSVVETISAWFERGQVTKAVAIGEMALAYNPTNMATPSSSESIRLENFAALEKVAPNPTFVTQTPERSGEYQIDLSNIIKTTVAFKYQVHLEDNSLATSAPLTIVPSWKIEPNQTSVILSYSLNPSFALPPGQTLDMHNVIISIDLQGNKALTCQSKPPCVFLKDKALLYWRLGDITLEANATPSKLLARISTETEGTPGSVEARWEIGGQQATYLGSGLKLSQSNVDAPGANAPGPVDPFADESVAASPNTAWKEVPSVRKLVSGKYVAA
ncbi:MAG: hypothetical protein M4579_003851 [Chaenotheca gracillima]|nr:MAG: hypothetical protein M4579_003851 [Chaenotheca gracillima]